MNARRVNTLTPSASSAAANTVSPPLDAAVMAPPPRRLGRYTLAGTLGEGAMGVVFKAHDPQLNRTVAIKTLRKSLFGSVEASAAAALRLRNEAQAAARLSHPGIVSVYEYGEDGDETFIAMEYVHGTPLAAWLAQPERLPVDDVLCLMVQLLAALQCAHDQGVWHRDIKPANLMITPVGRLKIADFGIARIDAVALTQEASVMGSPGYMAPECYVGTGVDHRADLYACGVLLYELLAGARPFRGSPDIVMYKTLHLPVPPLAAPDAPSFATLAAFEHVVQRALVKAPGERYASALEMREALTLAAGRAIPNALSAQAMQRLVSKPVGAGAAAGAALPADDRTLVTPRSRPPQATPSRAPISASWLPTSQAPMSQTPLGFESSMLDRVAAELADELGPVARLVVRRAAARSDTPAALLMRVANDALPAAQRTAFIDRARAALGPALFAASDARDSSLPPSGAALPVLGNSPLEASLITGAQALVARRLGPIAGWIVKRAAAESATREQFIERLADLAADGSDREQLLAALCRLR